MAASKAFLHDWALVSSFIPSPCFHSSSLLSSPLLAFVPMPQHKRWMPTLTRLVLFLALVAAVVYGAMYALANFVEPDTREITVEIPASKLKPVTIAPPPAPAAEPAPAETADTAPQSPQTPQE